MEKCVGIFMTPFLGRKKIIERFNDNGCCKINGSYTSPELAIQNGTRYLNILLVISMVLILTILINLIINSDDSIIIEGSIIQILFNLLQAVRKGILLRNCKSLQSSKYIYELLTVSSIPGIFAVSVYSSRQARNNASIKIG
jgi:hypothetical protein